VLQAGEIRSEIPLDSMRDSLRDSKRDSNEPATFHLQDQLIKDAEAEDGISFNLHLI